MARREAQECPACGRRVGVRVDGRLYRHLVGVLVGGRLRTYGLCVGSGFTPANLRRHAPYLGTERKR